MFFSRSNLCCRLDANVAFDWREKLLINYKKMNRLHSRWCDSDEVKNILVSRAIRCCNWSVKSEVACPRFSFAAFFCRQSCRDEASERTSEINLKTIRLCFSPSLVCVVLLFYFSLFCSKRNVNSWGSYFVLSSKSHSLLIRTWCASVPFAVVAFINWKWKAVKFRSESGMIRWRGALNDKCDLVIDDRASEEPRSDREITCASEDLTSRKWKQKRLCNEHENDAKNAVPAAQNLPQNPDSQCKWVLPVSQQSSLIRPSLWFIRTASVQKILIEDISAGCWIPRKFVAVRSPSWVH